eukprot:SAG22_NODE_83_length_21704_cov_58.556584_2_plen_187_part_00
MTSLSFSRHKGIAPAASFSLSYMQIDTLIEIDEGATAITLTNCLLTFTDTMLLRNGMHATFIGMDAQFGGSPSWVVTKSGETAIGQVCDAGDTNCDDDLCTIVDCGVGGSCTSLAGACECRTQHDGYSGDRCETQTCCGRGEGGGGGGGCARYPIFRVRILHFLRFTRKSGGGQKSSIPYYYPTLG